MMVEWDSVINSELTACKVDGQQLDKCYISKWDLWCFTSTQKAALGFVKSNYLIVCVKNCCNFNFDSDKKITVELSS